MQVKEDCEGRWLLPSHGQTVTDSASSFFFKKKQEYAFSTAKSIISLKHLQLFQPYFIMIVIISE